ncbi:MAG: SPOR domain-containing protein [Alphaproteobacteria bacterium]|nr:SPOR domain-containing protein [Alphaproteobacteria bacterium]
MMDINNNDFFGEIKKDEFEDEAVSSSGINYGETVNNKSSLKNILITMGVAAVAAGVVVLLMSPGKKTNQNNLAEIPTISPSEPIKIIPEDAKLNEVFESASVYNPTNFDDEAKNLITANKIVKPAPVPVVEPTVRRVQPVVAKRPLPPKPIAKVAHVSAPSQVAPAPVVKRVNVDESVINSKPTNIKGETELSSVKTSGGTVRSVVGTWNVQIVSTSSESAANKEWTSLVSKYPDLLKGLNHNISKTELNGKIYYRLRITNLETMARANEICNKLKENKVSCFVTK